MQDSASKTSPFRSPAFLRRLQKMIGTARGRPTRAELEIEQALRELSRPHSPDQDNPQRPAA
jgi:hypothetical protein